jgi:DNA-binding transcriptional ArsR family regulator
MGSPSSDVLERTFGALANSHRRQIVDHLVAGPVETPILARRFDMSKQALNKHLMVLEGAGMIERQLLGRVHRVRLRLEPLEAATDWLSTIRRGWETSLDQLGQLLEEEQ